MDDLTSMIETSLEVNCSSNNEADASKSRLSQYKRIGRCVSSHDKRRRQVLDEQKKNRDNVLTNFRGLLGEVHLEDQVCMEWSEVEKKNKTKVENKKLSLLILKQIMFSEWFLDIPYDFNINWFVKPCPVGKRTLLVTSRGRTLSFFKNGKFRRSMNSHLPGGSRVDCSAKNGNIVLDCIYNFDNDVHYVLDVLQWKIPVLSSTAEFRSYWLTSKWKELSLDLTDNSDNNYAKLVLLPHYSISDLAALMGSYPIFSDNNPELDGLLFYHKHGFYEPGRTPLVGWIKPFMLPEKLNVPVHEAYMIGKDSEDISELMKKENDRYYNAGGKKVNKHRKNPHRNDMDVSEPANDNKDMMDAS